MDQSPRRFPAGWNRGNASDGSLGGLVLQLVGQIRPVLRERGVVATQIAVGQARLILGLCRQRRDIGGCGLRSSDEQIHRRENPSKRSVPWLGPRRNDARITRLRRLTKSYFRPAKRCARWFSSQINSRFHAGNRSTGRTRVPHRPPATVHKRQEVTDDAIELVRRFEIDRVAAVRHDGEGGGGDVLLQQDAGQQAGPVLIPRQNERRHRQALHVLDEIVERRAVRAGRQAACSPSLAPNAPPAFS